MIFPSCEWLGAKSKIALMCSPLISDSSAPCTHQMQTPRLERDPEEPLAGVLG